MRHLMEPDPNSEMRMPSLRLVLWVVAMILFFVLLVAR